MKQREEPPEAIRSLLEITRPQLRQCAKTALSRHGATDKRIPQQTMDAYIERALQQTESECRDVTDAGTFCEILSRAIESHVDRDEIELAQIIENTNWSKTTKVTIATVVKRHGQKVNRFGKCAEDYVTEAIELLLERKRHFPFYRGLSLVKFLVRTVDNLYNHAQERMAKEGTHVSLTSKPSSEGRRRAARAGSGLGATEPRRRTDRCRKSSPPHRAPR
ncbi:MAG: hypothetical protein QOE68_3390 [Thermoanaerobaculia bacterium]|jgi:hypothetical protein|nr:hypothetical protein [Thermoanaerobaculia bacterium]